MIMLHELTGREVFLREDVIVGINTEGNPAITNVMVGDSRNFKVKETMQEVLNKLGVLTLKESHAFD